MTAINLSTRIRFVNADGTLTPEAYRSLIEIISRTGGVLGGSSGDTLVSTDPSTVDAPSVSEMVMQPIPDRAMTAPESVAVSASPFTYRAGRDGYFVVTGGTVSKQEYGRGATFTDVGLLTSMLSILTGDAIRVTYAAVPKITFIPR